MAVARDQMLKCARPNCRRKTIVVVSDVPSAIHEHVTDYHPKLQTRDQDGELIDCRCGDLQTA
jgi:hypothetical protein